MDLVYVLPIVTCSSQILLGYTAILVLPKMEG